MDSERWDTSVTWGWRHWGEQSIQVTLRVPKHWEGKYIRRRNDMYGCRCIDTEKMLPFMGMTNRRIGPSPAPEIEARVTTYRHTPEYKWVSPFHNADAYQRLKDVGDVTYASDGTCIELVGIQLVKMLNPEYRLWDVPLYSGQIMLKQTGLLPDKIEVMRDKRARGAERRTRWFYAKVIQRHWREARLNPYTEIGRNRLIREYNATLAG